AITTEAKGRNKPTIVSLSAPIQPNTEKAHGQYEANVFNFLLANKEPLGIKAVMKFTALLVDGAVELVDGKRLTVEVKFRMNWEKACQAEWQFRTFMKRPRGRVSFSTCRVDKDSRPLPVSYPNATRRPWNWPRISRLIFFSQRTPSEPLQK